MGYEENDLIGKRCFDFIHPDDLESTINKFNEVVAQ